MSQDRRENHRRFEAVDAAYRAGDLDALRHALGDPPDFPNCQPPVGIAIGDHPLEYAIYWSKLDFIERLIGAGADPNYEDGAGFPSLIAALSSDRRDIAALVTLLLDNGADVHQRGINDWTPLHYAVTQWDLPSVELLLRYGADPNARTRIDDCSSPLEDAEAIGFTAAVQVMRKAATPLCPK
jgi:ankyrin repeat protein